MYSGAQAGVVVPNGSFESPAYGNSGWGYLSGSPDGTWTYGGVSGVANENTPWLAGAPPDGTQAAFCQNPGCTISQSITGFLIGDSYAVSFYFAAAMSYPQVIEVQLGGAGLGAYSPTTSTFAPVTTVSMQATSDTMQLSFTGLPVFFGSNQTTVIDLVTIQDTSPTPTPEPSTLLLVVAGLALAGYLGKKRDRRAITHQS